MNYFLLALATLAAFVAFIHTANILRVAFGTATWNSGFAAFWSLAVAPAAGVTALWLYPIAIAG